MTFYSPVSDEVAQAMCQPHVDMVIAIKISLENDDVRAHTGAGPLVINGETYYGVGSFGEIGSVKEEHTTSASKLSLTLNGLDQSLIAHVLNTNVVGRSVEEYLVVIQNGAPLAANLIFKGKIADTGLGAGGTNAIRLTASNIFEDWQRAANKRYTEQSHIKDHPGDHVFRYVAQMAERTILWGAKADAPGFSYS